jgi:hypothetical protein
VNVCWHGWLAGWLGVRGGGWVGVCCSPWMGLRATRFVTDGITRRHARTDTRREPLCAGVPGPVPVCRYAGPYFSRARPHGAALAASRPPAGSRGPAGGHATEARGL